MSSLLQRSVWREDLFLHLVKTQISLIPMSVLNPYFVKKQTRFIAIFFEWNVTRVKWRINFKMELSLTTE